MARTANVFARVEPEVKEQAEQVLDRLGMTIYSISTRAEEHSTSAIPFSASSIC